MCGKKPGEKMKLCYCKVTYRLFFYCSRLCCAKLSAIYISFARTVFTEQRTIETVSEPKNQLKIPNEISVINLNTCQPQNVSSVHQEEEQRQRRSEGKGKKLFWCKTTLVFSPLLPVPRWSRAKRPSPNPWSLEATLFFHCLQVTGRCRLTAQRISRSTMISDKCLTEICVICSTFLTLSWNI